MIDVSVQTRMVLVLGHGRHDADPARWIDRAAERNAPLMVLSLGDPVSASQQAFVEQAIDHAFGAGVSLDAVWVPEVDGLTAHIERGDDITVEASDREERRIASALER